MYALRKVQRGLQLSTMLSLVFTGFLTVAVLLNNEISAATCLSWTIPNDAAVIDVCSESQATGRMVYINGAGAARSANVTQNTCFCNVILQHNPSSMKINIDVSTPGYSISDPVSCGSRFELQNSGGTVQFGCYLTSTTYPYDNENFNVTFRKTSAPWSVDYCLGILPGSNATVTVKCFDNTATTSKASSTTAAVKTTTTTHVTDTISTTNINARTLKPTTDTLSTNQTTEKTSSEERSISTLAPTVPRPSTLATSTESSKKIVDGKDSIVPVAAGAGAGALVVIIIVVVSSVFLCRSKKRKETQKETNEDHVDVGMIDIDMVENALYISTNIDQNKTAGTNSSTEIRHIEMEGGDVYALPSKGAIPANGSN